MNKKNNRVYAEIHLDAVEDNFENMYKQYHNLGVNGVMDDLYDKFMNLPLEKRC